MPRPRKQGLPADGGLAFRACKSFNAFCKDRMQSWLSRVTRVVGKLSLHVNAGQSRPTEERNLQSIFYHVICCPDLINKVLAPRVWWNILAYIAIFVISLLRESRALFRSLNFWTTFNLCNLSLISAGVWYFSGRRYLSRIPCSHIDFCSVTMKTKWMQISVFHAQFLWLNYVWRSKNRPANN